MSRLPFDLVIFDCDGVLVDSERLCVKVDAVIVADLGCHFTEQEILDTFVGSSHEVYTAAIEARLGRRLAPDWHRAYALLYEEIFDAELAAVDGVVEALEALADLGALVCVASNGSHEDIRRSLGLTGLAARFEGRVFSAADVPRGKPAPDLFLHAARASGAEPARCAVIEDSPYGVRAARAAGMRPYGYSGGLTPAERLRGAGAAEVFEDMRELTQRLARPAAYEPG